MGHFKAGFLRRILVAASIIGLVTLAIGGCKNGGGGGGGGGGSTGAGTTNPSSSSNASSSSYTLYGLNFSPYTDLQDPNTGSVVGSAQIRSRLQLLIAGEQPDSDWIRTFGATGGLELVPQIARELGFKTAIGAWLGPDPDANEREINALIELIDRGVVDLAIVGSETLLRGDLTPDELIHYIELVRGATEDTGVPITTADTYDQWLKYPQVVDASDIILVNYFPFWEGVEIGDAIPTLHRWHQWMVAAANGKEVIVSESGWPSEGGSIGDADATSENAAKYFLDFVSWARAENVDYFYFEALDQPWKAMYEGEVGAHWGIRDQYGELKEGMEVVFNNVTVDDYWTQNIIDGPGDPAIVFTSVPPIGSFSDLLGRASHIDPTEYYVAVYIRVGSGWWTKPTFDNPLTPISADGAWSTDITTGGTDELASEIVAYLIPASYSPPLLSGESELPTELQANAVASVSVAR